MVETLLVVVVQELLTQLMEHGLQIHLQALVADMLVEVEVEAKMVVQVVVQEVEAQELKTVEQQELPTQVVVVVEDGTLQEVLEVQA